MIKIEKRGKREKLERKGKEGQTTNLSPKRTGRAGSHVVRVAKEPRAVHKSFFLIFVFQIF